MKEEYGGLRVKVLSQACVCVCVWVSLKNLLSGVFIIHPCAALAGALSSMQTCLGSKFKLHVH